MIWDKIPWKDIEDYLDKTVGKTFDTLFSGMDSQEDEVKAKMDADLAKSRDLLADEIIYDSCKRTALIGGGAALPDLLPLGGWPMMIASIGTDFTLTLREELVLLNKLAYLYGMEADRTVRKREAIGLLAAVRASEGSPKGNATAEVTKLMAVMGAKHASTRLIVEIGRRFFQKKLVALIPGLGILLSGGVNYYSTKALGEYAKVYYRKQQVGAPEVDDVLVRIQHFQKCFLKVMLNMAKVDRKVPPEEEELLKDSLMMFGYTKEEKDSYLAELWNLEAANPLTVDEVRALSQEDRQYIFKQAVAMMLVDNHASEAEERYLDLLRKQMGVTEATVAKLRETVREELGQTAEG